MPGSAPLDDSLVDSLIPMQDELRGLNTDFGLRQVRVFVVKRRWAGARRGEPQGSTPALVFEREILPRPRFSLPNNLGALHHELPPSGREETGRAQLDEVSLTYTHAELTGEPVAPNEQVFYRVVDAMGQGLPNRYFVLAAPPEADREKTISWVIELERAEIKE